MLQYCLQSDFDDHSDEGRCNFLDGIALEIMVQTYSMLTIVLETMMKNRVAQLWFPVVLGITGMACRESRRIILDRDHAEDYGEDLHHDHGHVEPGAREEHHE